MPQRAERASHVHLDRLDGNAQRHRDLGVAQMPLPPQQEDLARPRRQLVHGRAAWPPRAPRPPVARRPRLTIRRLTRAARARCGRATGARHAHDAGNRSPRGVSRCTDRRAHSHGLPSASGSSRSEGRRRSPTLRRSPESERTDRRSGRAPRNAPETPRRTRPRSPGGLPR